MMITAPTISASTPMLFMVAAARTLTKLMIVALLATCTMLQLTAARVLWSQGRDGDMPFAGFLARVSRNRVPFNATVVAFGMTVIFLIAASFSSTALAVLAGLTSLSWALAYGLVVCTGLYGLVTKKLPHRPFNSGRFSVVVFVAAVLWSVVICVVLVWQNPTQVGGGMLGSIVIGAIVYAFIPKSRRGKGAAKTVGARAADLAVLTLEARFPSMAPLGGLFATQRCHRG
jgi:amino acid transporter